MAKNLCRGCGAELTDEPEREAGICRACVQEEDEGSEGGFALEIDGLED